ncbi:class I SAM-dependent methyltransferase [Phreatobacter oligotrophus]|jgi:SAM-dependent methyltransferase|uniref:Methyltransferase family protein n=1 Tax=Phreatobacter oligotrophus TaxID=1122261 RepID=A0A2T4YWL3_9HYPH|nr:class I SAM-dependent methyltransferase [Phreatobacter oligotrophus]PTM49048.1 methyltransferase family protein [Phreatobacter oligotrophus]
MTTERQAHWENVYSTKGETEVSWFQESPQPSLDLMALVGAKADSAIIDIGGGASRLVDALLAEGFTDISVLDLSAEALDVAHARLGDAGHRVKWIVDDATEWEPPQLYDVWHDRAAFHFLNGEDQRQAYLQRVREGLRTGGYIIMGTFALDGPERCSGLPVTRYSTESLSAFLGEGFALVDSRRHEHATPWGAVQRFVFGTFKRVS